MADQHDDDQQQQQDSDQEEQSWCDEGLPGPAYGCEPLPKGPKPPHLDKPKDCKPRCDCPGTNPPPRTCFDDLIARQESIVNRAARASQTKDALAKLRDDANAAKSTYTRQIYDDLKKRWEQLDKEVVGAIEFVTCNVKCWWCVIECHICPEIYRIAWIEERLYGKDVLIHDAHSLSDIEYWHQRNVIAKERVVKRIDAVLKAWKDPAKTIDEALKKNEQIVGMAGSIRKMDPVDGLLTVFFDLIPRHLALAPRSIDSPQDIDTAIAQKYRKLCSECDPVPEPDDCCGPDVSLPNVRQRLIPPEAFIVEPDKYYEVLCCLITQRFEPAQRQFEKATVDHEQVKSEIVNLKAELEKRLDKPFADFKANIVSPIDCEKYTKSDGADGDCGCDDKEQSSDANAS